MEKHSAAGAADIALAALGLIALLGISTLAAPCGPKPDGSFMLCHWAGRTASAVALVLVILSAARLFLHDAGVKRGLLIAVLADAALLFAVPGRLIDLCLVSQMRCHLIFEPFVMVASGLIFFASLAMLLSGKSGAGQQAK